MRGFFKAWGWCSSYLLAVVVATYATLAAAGYEYDGGEPWTSSLILIGIILLMGMLMPHALPVTNKGTHYD